MKTEEQIKNKVEKVFQKRLEQRKEKYLGRHYRNCLFNLQKDIDGIEHCFCTNTSNPKVQSELISFCEEADVCDKCDFYSCKHTEKSVEEQFIQDIANPSTCGIKEPKLAVLLWVLNGSEKNEEDCEVKKEGFFASLLKKIFKKG